MDFTKKSLLELRQLSIEELSKYYMEERRNCFEKGDKLRNIWLRKRIHLLLLLIIKIDRLVAKESLTIISDERVKSKSPKIYACTHIGGNDIQRTFEAIKEHAYLFLGDPKGIYRDATGILLNLNGVIPLETNNRLDRKIAKSRSIELLNKGANLLIYPEGAWNIFVNLPVMKLYDGTSIIAQETGADVIPIGIEQYDKDFFVCIGENIKVGKMLDMPYKELTSLIRDEMATQKWKIWESRPRGNHEELAKIQLEQFQQEIIDRCGYGFTIQDVLDTMYHDKHIVTSDEAFSFQKKLVK